MELDEIAKHLNALVLEKYQNHYQASLSTGLHSSAFSRIVKQPTISNILRVANACGFKITFNVEAA